MRKQFHFLALAAMTLALGACNNEDDAVVAGKQITVDTSIGAMTRVATTGDVSVFEPGDQINVYAWTGAANEVPAERVVDGAVNTYDGTKWTAMPQMLWADMVSEHYFLAVYPSHDITDFKSDPYTLNTADQETSDLLIAVNNGGLTARDEAVRLVFDHAMAKLNINMNFRNQFGDATPTPSEVKLYCGKTATVNYLLQTVTADAYVFDATKYIAMPALETPATGFDKSYSSIVVPQTGVNIVDIVIDGTTYRYEGVEDLPFTTGKVTTLNLNVGKDEITLAGVTVGGWNEGETLPGGEAEEVTHEYVDLGLPTGTLWATCNVGANAPEEVGDYFAWGETDPKTDYSWSTYKYGSSSDQLTKYCNSSDYGKDGFTDNLVTLEALDDAATANWGSDWRMPTKAELEELVDKCTWTWTTSYNSTGVAGFIVSSNAEGNTNAIFLPATSYRYDTDEPSSIGSFGYYWCSSLETGINPKYAWSIRIYSAYGGNKDMQFHDRYYGLSVRAVRSAE